MKGGYRVYRLAVMVCLMEHTQNWTIYIETKKAINIKTWDLVLMYMLVSLVACRSSVLC
jgi:hypothetical protein